MHRSTYSCFYWTEWFNPDTGRRWLASGGSAELIHTKAVTILQQRNRVSDAGLTDSGCCCCAS